jgi:hypothetical protein
MVSFRAKIKNMGEFQAIFIVPVLNEEHAKECLVHPSNITH